MLSMREVMRVDMRILGGARGVEQAGDVRPGRGLGVRREEHVDVVTLPMLA